MTDQRTWCRIAFFTDSGEPTCSCQCGLAEGDDIYAPGNFVRDGLTLTCVDCGERWREPPHVTLDRHERLLTALAKREGIDNDRL
jgi:hypothetical protein